MGAGWICCLEPRTRGSPCGDLYPPGTQRDLLRLRKHFSHQATASLLPEELIKNRGHVEKGWYL